ncbi:MAG: PilN domain-containing protein [Candidatus Omnitrophica bacterium]|nr:PilN domain-containing protein [Candidatus Omnitrophota bacterium]
MRVKIRNTKFLIQITDGFLKVLRCYVSGKSIFRLDKVCVEQIPIDITERDLSEKIQRTLKSLNYSNNPVFISLPRAQAICRYLKLPTKIPSEIAKIVDLQAPHYLPYQINELITGYEVVAVDVEGYSYVNLVMVYRDLIERYFRIFKELKPKGITASLSSYGLCNLYNYIETGQPYPSMIIDIDANHVESVIVSDKKLVFSRTFKINRSSPEWQEVFIEELNKTQSAYSKDISKEMPKSIIIFSEDREAQRLQDILSQRLSIPLKVYSYTQKLKVSPELLKVAADLGVSVANLLGLALTDMPESVNLLPRELKERRLKTHRRKEALKKIVFVGVVFCMFIIGFNKNIDNKSRYLQMLKVQLGEVSREAKPLEEIEKRIAILESSSQKRLNAVQLIYELSQAIPNGVYLVSIIYNQDGQVILRGQSQELNFAFEFVRGLEASSFFKNFEVNMRYATKKRTRTGESVDFEVICLKR